MSACSSRSSWLARSEQRPAPAARRARPLLALGLALGAALAARGAQSSDVAGLMDELSRTFRELELHSSSGDLERVAAVAGEMRELLGRPSERERPEAEPLAAQLARLDAAAAELGELAGRGRVLGAGQAFEQLRASCVACHVRFRQDNDVRGNFPARDNTISGVVELLDADGRARADRSWVLVFLEGPAQEPSLVHERPNPRISQKNRRFEPRVLPVMVGTEVEFPNDDTIFHNVFSLSKAAPFDLGVYEPGQTAAVRMQRTGLVKVYCNMHPDMAASIVVLDNPWFALTDADGSFVIPGVPDGEYTLRGWNDMGAEVREPLQVQGALLVERRLVLHETRRSLGHTNKFGGAYAGSYR
jgi:plastocyanin